MTSQKPEQCVPPPFLYFDSLPAWRNQPPHAQLVAGPQGPTVVHKPRGKDRPLRWPYPARALLVVVLLLGLCVAAVCWNAKPLPALPPQLLGFDLRHEPAAPKVYSTSAEVPLLPAPPTPMVKQRAQPPAPMIPEILPPPQLVVPPQPIVLAPPKLVLPAPEVQLPLPPPLPPPVVEVKPHVVELEAPLVPLTLVLYGPGALECSCFRDLQHGETPMLNNWNVIKLTSLMAAVLAVNPVPAASPPAGGQVDPKATKELIDDVKNSLDKLNENLTKALSVQAEVKTLRENSSNAALSMETMKSTIKSLEDQVATLKAEVEKLQGREPARFPAEKTGLDDIKTRVMQMEKLMAKLADTRIAKASPVTTGRILLVNKYPEEMLFIINNQAHKVAPFATVPLENQPVGAFYYEVISPTYRSIGSNRPLLEAGQTYTITVK